MTEASPAPRDEPNGSPLDSLGADSYTAHRLEHSTPEHLHLTTRRVFIGPIPEGWLRSHRRDWYRHHLNLNYSSRAVTFTANPKTSRQRRLTGIDGPSLSASHQTSFPQPEDLDEEEDDDNQAPKDAAAKDGTAGALKDRHAVSSARTPSAYRDPDDSSGLLTRVEEEAPPITLHTTKGSPSASSRAVSDPPTSTKRSKRTGGTSVDTATESLVPVKSSESAAEVESARSRQINDGPELSLGESADQGGTFVGRDSPTAREQSSAASLLKHGDTRAKSSPGRSILAKIKSKATQPQDVDGAAETTEADREAAPSKSKIQSGLVRFNIPEAEAEREQVLKVRLATLQKRNTFKRIRKSRIRDGEIVKMEKMLVRIEATSHELSADYNENESQGVEARTLEKWREFMMVCRESASEDGEFILQMYKTRVIPAVEPSNVKSKSTHVIHLNRKTTRVNLYSSLDKTIVIWTPHINTTRIYIMRPRSSGDSMEWYTFLRSVLGWDRSSILQVNVPDLEVSLRLENPFQGVEASRDIIQAAQGDEEALKRTMKEEQAAAANIVQRCLGMLEKSPEWTDVVSKWTPSNDTEIEDGPTLPASEGEDHMVRPVPSQQPVGLAWKRYDRLEWVYGANEKKMYGTMAMDKSHELELRPKQHYPSSTLNKKGKTIVEPAPVEGFLVRLTSQRGVDRRFGRLFFKRLYFSSHSQFLVFSRPATADPPPPPALPMKGTGKVPSSHDIATSIPLIYAVNPFPLAKGDVQWLADKSLSQSERIKHDKDAYDEHERKTNLLLHCDGNINLCNVVKVRDARRGATNADENVDEGSEVDFDQSVEDTAQEDGTVRDFDDARTFELVLKNGLIVRLQTYDKTTKLEWQKRLRALVRYWKLRCAADIALYKSVRHENLVRLNIDEDTEAFMGQFAPKWEVVNSFASPELYNMCGISSCRAVHMAGSLFYKRRLRGTFRNCLAILSHGHLLLFDDTLRSRSGALQTQTHNDRVSHMNLRDCYVYSGLITENDLQYRSQGYDKSRPGYHALPRIWPSDGWTSIDEDTMTCFVVWHGKRKSWFRSEMTAHEGVRKRVKLVSRLGKEGKSLVFKTRSRAERDHWVMSISTEIERLSQGEDVRIVGEESMT